MKPAVLVTGATGFLGAALVRELAARGHAVHALARAGSDRSALDGVKVWWHAGDLENEPSLERAVAEVCENGAQPWIAHSAAVISYRTRDRQLQRRVNVDGTRALLGACRRHPVGRVLHISSVVAVGHARPGELLDEDAPFNGAELRCDYVDTKRAAEEFALDAAGELDLVVVNPGAIFGPNPREGNTGRFLRQLAREALGPFAPPGSLSVVGVEDVARGCVLALERGARGRRYLLVESAHTALEAFRIAARILDVRAPRWTVPAPLWSSVALAAQAVDAVHPTEVFTPPTLRMLGAHFRFHSKRAREELGWQPRPFEEVLRATIEELRRRGALDRP